MAAIAVLRHHAAEDEFAGNDVAAGIEQLLGKTYLQIGNLLAAEQHARSAYALHRKVHKGRHEDVAADLSPLAETQWRRGRLAGADSLAREARAYLGKIMGDPSPNLLWLYIELGGALGAEGPSREADSLFASVANSPKGQLPRTTCCDST